MKELNSCLGVIGLVLLFLARGFLDFTHFVCFARNDGHLFPLSFPHIAVMSSRRRDISLLFSIKFRIFAMPSFENKKRLEVMITKTQLRTVSDKLPETFTIDDVIDRLIFIEKVQVGLEQSEKNIVNTKVEAEEKLSKWLR
ncbi:MAG: hypothetical protein FWC94_05695 [Bacteroidales bacterium]|nr:hypothetical protein [Bacteroidales bacterium]